MLMRFFTLRSSKIEVFGTYSYDLVTTQYDHPKYVKHVSGRIYMCFSPYLGIRPGGGGGGGVSKGLVHKPAYAVFHPPQLNN